MKWLLATMISAMLAGSLPDEGAIAWRTDYDVAMKQARKQRRPVIIEFGAEWCTPCKEMERTTFKDAAVVGESRRFVTLRVDSTEMNAQNTRLSQRYGVVSLPVIVFIDSKGKVRNEVRVEEFVDATELVARMKKVK